MGISAILSSLVKGITWSKVVSVAMEYGPEFYRKSRERFQPDATPDIVAENSALQERVTRLEKLLLEQEVVIRGQAAINEQLEKNCLELEGRLQLLKIGTGVLVLGCIVLLALLFR